MDQDHIDPQRETHAQIAVETMKWLAEIYRIMLVEEGIEYPNLVNDVVSLGVQVGDITGEALQRMRMKAAAEEARNPMRPKSTREYREEVFRKNLVMF